jgi:hypothetical protein
MFAGRIVCAHFWLHLFTFELPLPGSPPTSTAPSVSAGGKQPWSNWTKQQLAQLCEGDVAINWEMLPSTVMVDSMSSNCNITDVHLKNNIGESTRVISGRLYMGITAMFDRSKLASTACLSAWSQLNTFRDRTNTEFVIAAPLFVQVGFCHLLMLLHPLHHAKYVSAYNRSQLLHGRPHFNKRSFVLAERLRSADEAPAKSTEPLYLVPCTEMVRVGAPVALKRANSVVAFVQSLVAHKRKEQAGVKAPFIVDAITIG